MKHQLLILIVTIMTISCTPNTAIEKQVLKNWKISSKAKVYENLEQLSQKDYNDSEWLAAQVPSTVMGILSKLPEYENVLDTETYYQVDKTIFDKGWIYRTEFEIPTNAAQKTTLLHFEGISYRANVWLNGQQVASADTVFGPFRQFEFNITPHIQVGQNILAVEVIRQYEGDFGLGFVDWNPRPLDENMGLWRPVYIETFDKVQLKNSFVRSKVNTETLDEAWLTVGTTLKNFDNKPINGNVQISFNGATYKYPVSLAANSEKEIQLSAENIPGLYIENPKLWWCSGLGEPNLYKMQLEFKSNNIISSENIEFGIREIESYFNETGVRGFKLNGHEILIKGAGWTDEIFLRDTPESNALQVKYVKDMGMNTIRFETIWGSSRNIYQQCDQQGILSMVGWSCQWEWENYLGKACDDFGGANSKEDFDLLSNYMIDQILWLRNHPSIFVWLVGSDMIPRPELEKRYIDIFNNYDNRPWLGAASNRSSELTGPTGVKMEGPYEYVGPSYWYIDKKYGGAFGFNTETGPGAILPVKESIEKMLPADQRWPLNSHWDQYCTTSETNLNTMRVNTETLNQQWGEATSFDNYIIKSHLVNYEAVRSMFEAFRVNRPQATGVIQWMLNSAWPSFYWQLYDYYLVPTPAYYATKKALAPVQLIYNYGNYSIVAANEQLQSLEKATAKITLFNASSEIIKEFKQEVSIPANGSITIANIGKPEQTMLLFLEINDENGKHLSDNFYWLSARDEKYDWEKTNWVYTPMSQYPDYSELNNMQQVALNLSTRIVSKLKIEVEIENPSSTISMFNQLKVHNEKGDWVIPAFYSENYFSMKPGEKKTIEINLSENISHPLWIELSGWNTSKQNIEIMP
ncbi:MAG TPA: beta galactosidase jelly roll domain-containing protein [Prolixibacteraceae bacterium]|nr:beta galactosidase jelly roll domain-containing protein [Prolixibacteraceae bacterium]